MAVSFALFLTGILLLPEGAAPAAPTASATATTATAMPLTDADAVVIVNGEALSKGAYKEMLFEQLGDGYLDVVINEMLINAKARALKLEPTQKDLDGWIDDQVRQATGMAELKDMLEANELRQKYKRHARMGFLLERLVKDSRTDEAGLKREYDVRFGEKRKVRHILISTGGEEGPGAELPEEIEKAKKKAVEIHDQLKKGADFAAMAKKESQDPGSAETGGDLPGEIDANTPVVPEFLEVVLKLKEGELSEPTKSQFGYHIIQVTKLLPPAKPYDDATKKELREEAVKRPVDRMELSRYLDDIRKGATVDRKIE